MKRLAGLIVILLVLLLAACTDTNTGDDNAPAIGGGDGGSGEGGGGDGGSGDGGGGDGGGGDGGSGDGGDGGSGDGGSGDGGNGDGGSGDGGSGDGGSGDGGDGESPNLPSGPVGLLAADMPTVMPCPSQDVLTDTPKLDLLKAAIRQGALLYLDVPFDINDPLIIKKKCGFENSWNPVDNTDEIPPAQSPVTLSDLFLSGNAGICAAGFTTSSFGLGEGFPEAGTYRKEFKAALMGVTYHVRLRVTVSGSSAGNTFRSEGIAVPGDIQNTLIYEVDGATTAHADLLDTVATAFRHPHLRFHRFAWIFGSTEVGRLSLARWSR